MHSYYTFIAFELATDRAREADRYRLAAAARESRDRSTRRSIAIGLAVVGRLVARLVRRLDGCVADDLAESIRPGGLAASS
jgi:hypothetical protein